MIMIQDSNSWYEDMITDNGICHITEDIILTNNIVLGNNTTLIFEGGIIKGNYTLTGKNTRIISSAFTQLFSGVLLAGTWRHTHCYAEWWRDEEDEDDTNSINLALASSIESVKLRDINYQISDSLVISSHKALIGTRNTIEESITQITASGYSSYTKNIITLHSSFVSIKDINILSQDSRLNGVCTDDGPEESDDCYRLLIDGVSVTNCKIGFFFYTYLTVIRGCEAKDVNCGFYFSSGTSVSMSDCNVQSYTENAYKIEELCYSTFTRCCANNLINVKVSNNPDFAFHLLRPHSVSLVECNCNNVENGIYNESGSNIKIVDCSIDMSKMQSTSPQGRVMKFHNVRYCNVQRFQIYKNKDSDWPSQDDWKNYSNIIYVESTNNAFKTILLNEVVASSHSNPNSCMSLSASHVNTYVSEFSEATIVTVDRNWAKSGPASMRPESPEVTDITGLGWTYFNTSTNRVEVWTGNSWLSID